MADDTSKTDEPKVKPEPKAKGLTAAKAKELEAPAVATITFQEGRVVDVTLTNSKNVNLPKINRAMRQLTKLFKKARHGERHALTVYNTEQRRKERAKLEKTLEVSEVEYDKLASSTKPEDQEKRTKLKVTIRNTREKLSQLPIA
jgi:hypothetical protein